MTTAPLCFLDTETSGVHPGRRVWEIGMVRREPDGTEREKQFFVEVDLSNADPFGLNVGRFYERHPYGRYLAGHTVIPPRPGDVIPRLTAAREVARFTHGAHIVGAVRNFDTDVLGRLLRDHGLIPAWHYHLIDVENLAFGYLAGLGKRTKIAPPWNSDALTGALGLDPVPAEERHTALGDARWAQRIYDHVMLGGARC